MSVETHAAPTAARPPLRMSYDEYKNTTFEGGLTEWVDGEVIFFMPPKDQHQNVVEFLDRLLGLFVQLFKLGKLRVAPFSMRVLLDGPAREPDLFFLAAEHLDRLTETELNGPADLAIEIISDESVGRDRGDKFYEYQEGGVREYWIIDPRPGKQRADFYVLDGRGMFQPVPIAADGIYRSTVLPNFWLKVDWLWAEEPNPLAALAQIVGMEQLIAALQKES
ncbi:MAG: Uma2 family endonuclease [Roseiflexaceae bacterium]